MPLRCFKPYTVTTVAQPLISTTLSAAITGNDATTQTVPVADSSMFVNSDTVNMSAVTGGPSTELAVQIQVLSATTVSGVFKKNHASGEYMILSYPCMNTNVVSVGLHTLTASVFLGFGPVLPTTVGVNAFWDLSANGNWAPPMALYDSDNTANYWIIAASGTQYYLPSAKQG